MTPKHLFELCRKAVMTWVDDYAPSMGAAISYYTIFSLAPLLVIVIAVAGAVFGRDAVQDQIVGQIGGLVGDEGASAVQAMLRAASDTDKGLIAGIISFGVLLLGATTVFAELQSALDRIWQVPEKEKPSGIWAVVRARVLSFGLILGLAFLLMVSLLVSAGLSAFDGWFGGLLPGWEVLLQGVNILISFAILTLLFAMIFKLMPSTPIAWRDVWIGAAVTAVLFEVGKLLIGLYLGKSGVTESFAAAGSLVVLVAWVYYAAQIFLLGAEFTKVYADEHGSLAPASAREGKPVSSERSGGEPPQGTRSGVPLGAQDVPDYSAIARTAETQREIDRRVSYASRTLVRRVALLAALAIGNLLIERRTRLVRKKKRT
ncbi:YihY/virulence factor BrkB family protein [Variovorax saccharolyticus]|uniref:YihY/virulence factor BrkB family protein n=1 Tax=Variovorax saccharolyticus TaxID=3053516 RepID=UPI002574C730|nr:YihY/virulence factor BrkB family protein [Variovorax sp. J31P216]MDM0029688.1 YihY/virulence factor BrkB family protein [Variovorax sp. J31P216]